MTQQEGSLVNVDTPAVVWNGSAANEHIVSIILRHYASPLAAKASSIVTKARTEMINPLLLLAVMKVESNFANKNSRPDLKPENVANPFSVHFNPAAAGIMKLRLQNGAMPSFEESLQAFIRMFKARSSGSQTPIATYALRDKSLSSWTSNVCAAFQTIQARVAQGR